MCFFGVFFFFGGGGGLKKLKKCFNVFITGLVVSKEGSYNILPTAVLVLCVASGQKAV